MSAPGTTMRSRLDAKLVANKVFTDLSEFELNNDENDSETMFSLLEHIRETLSKSECSNIGSIKWNKSFLDKITTTVVAPQIKRKFEEIEKQLILNNEKSSEKFPNDFTYCLLCRHVYTDDKIINEASLNQDQDRSSIISSSKQEEKVDKTVLESKETKIEQPNNLLYRDKQRSSFMKSLKYKASRLSKRLDKPLINICEPPAENSKSLTLVNPQTSVVAQLVRSSIHIDKSFAGASDTTKKNNHNTFERLKHFLIDEKWIIDRIHVVEDGGYKSVLYRNDIKRQFVYAYQGNTRLDQSLDLSELFKSQSEKNNIEPFFYSCLANISLANQTEHVHKYVDECVRLSKEKNYSLSFTGYSFGAWLAEQSVLFCHRDFECEDVRAVTFESPGSYEYLERLNTRSVHSPDTKFDLDQLDIRAYVTLPNFVNTSNMHVGKLFRVILGGSEDDEEVFVMAHDYVNDMHEFVTSLIKKMPTINLCMKLQEFYVSKVQEHINEFGFYLNGLKSLFVNGLDLILNEFNSESKDQRPRAYKKVLDWPKVNFEPSDTFKENFQKLPSQIVRGVWDTLPGSELVPLNLKKLAVKLVTTIPSKALETISQEYMSGATVIINFLIEILNGNLSNEQCTKFFALNTKNNDASPNSANNKTDKQLVVNTKSFKLLYEAHYRDEPVNWQQEEVKILTRGILENYLYQLQLNQNEIDKLKNPLLIKQLKSLVTLFEMDNSDGTKYLIKSKNNNVDVERIKALLRRLMDCEPKLRTFLENPNFFSQRQPSIKTTTSQRLSDHFEAPKLGYFFGRDFDISKIEEMFKRFQYVILRGKKGMGKLTLAREYGYKLSSQNPNYIIRIFDSTEYISELEYLARGLKLDDDLISDIKQNTNEIKLRLNQYTKENRFNILFIINNCNNAESSIECLDYFMSDFDKKFIKCLFITKSPRLHNHLDDECVHEVNYFDADTCKRFFEWRKVNKILKPNEIDEMYELIGLKFGLLPMNVSKKILDKIETNVTWDFSEIRNEINTNYFSLESVSHEYGLDILKCLAYVNPEKSVSYQLIKSVFISKSDSDLKSDLNYLVNNSELVQTEDREYRILELTQYELRQVFKSDSNNLLNKLVLALNTLIRFDMCTYQSERQFFENDDLEKLFYHAQTVLNNYEWPAKLTNKNCGQLYEKLAKINSEYLLKYDESLNCLSKALNIYKQTPSSWPLLAARTSTISNNEKDLLIANIYNSMGNSKFQLGKYREAIDCFELALNIYNSLSPKSLLNIATITNNIGFMHLSMGDYVKAFNGFEKSNDLYRQCLSSPDHPNIAVSASNMGLLYFYKGEYELALDNYEKALGIYKKNSNANLVRIATLSRNIGNVYFNQGHYELAMEEFQNSLEIYEASLPSNHSGIASSIWNKGRVMFRQGEYKVALEDYTTAMDLFLKSLSIEHPNIALLKKSLGELYYVQGDFESAIKLYEESLSIFGKTVLKNHPNIALLLNNLGCLYREMKDYEKAKEFFDNSLNMAKEKLPLNHPDIAKIYSDIGLNCLAQGNLTDAYKNFIDAINIWKQTSLKTDHANIVLAQKNLESVKEALQNSSI